MRLFLFMSCVLFFSFVVSGQAFSGAERSLTRVQKHEIINDINDVLMKNYIIEESIGKITSHLTTRLTAGAYDAYNSAVDFAQIIEEDLMEIGQDKHLGFMYNPEWSREVLALKEPDSDLARRITAKYYEEERLQNFGFQKLEILGGMVGYLDIRLFPTDEYGSETAIAAMNFLANTDAIIIDLRHNGGGNGAVPLLCSYFFKERTQLNGIEFRDESKREQNWTLSYVPGKRFIDKDLYILTSSRTFSAAEDFTYAMKSLGRATIIGERTKGGAHPIEYFTIKQDFILIVPIAASFNPYTGKNWEGTGIEPDIAVPQEQALVTAHRRALEKLLEKEQNEAKRYSQQWALDGIKAREVPFQLDVQAMRDLTGCYGERKIILDGDSLYYIRGVRYRMLPLSPTVFILENLDEMRVEFIRNPEGIVTEINLLLNTGKIYPIKRNPPETENVQ